MSSDTLLAIAGMALVTFAIRAGGLLLAERLPASGFAAAWMRHIPGAVLASLVAPAVVDGGPSAWFAAAIGSLVYLATRNLFATMVMGVLAVFIARRFLGL